MKPGIVELNNEDVPEDDNVNSSFIGNIDKSKVEENIPLKTKHSEIKKKKILNKEEWVKVRSERLLKSKEKNRRTIIFQFIFFSLFFFGVFIADFIIETDFSSGIKLSYQHLKKIIMQPGTIKYVAVYTYEEIAEKEPRIYQG